MMHDLRHPQHVREVELNRLIAVGAFAAGVDAARLRHDLSAGLVDRRDVATLQRLLTHVERTARVFALLSDDARERLGIPRLVRRVDAACGLIDSGARL